VEAVLYIQLPIRGHLAKGPPVICASLSRGEVDAMVLPLGDIARGAGIQPISRCRPQVIHNGQIRPCGFNDIRHTIESPESIDKLRSLIALCDGPPDSGVAPTIDSRWREWRTTCECSHRSSHTPGAALHRSNRQCNQCNTHCDAISLHVD